jgi:predicted ATPase
VRGAFNDYRRAGYELGVTALDVLWSPALLLHNQPETALEIVEQGLSTGDRNNERLFEAELYRLKARALLARVCPHPEAIGQAEALLRHGILVAKSQKARVLELRAVKDLAALWLAQGRKSEAIDILAPLYESFTEGHGTHDLEEARALLVGTDYLQSIAS